MPAMEVRVGACGLVIAFFSTVFGVVDIGLWVACYFECQTGREIAFNYFAAVWTGCLAFASGFMISVLFCVKFRFLGSFIIAVTCVLVPCEIFCACIYGYRAYQSREHLELDVPMFIGMSVCSAVLFVITIMWNCYYCCIATPQEDYEEEMKEVLEEQEKEQETIRHMEERLTNNPIVDDNHRNGYPGTSLFPPSSSSRLPMAAANRPPQQLQQQYRRQRELLEQQQQEYRPREGSYPQSGPHQKQSHRHVNRPANYPQAALVRDDYPYPSAFTRERVPRTEREQQNARSSQQQEGMFRLPRASASHIGQSQQGAIDNGRGQINLGYEPDAFGRPIVNEDEAYSSRSYLFDGAQGEEYNQQTQLNRYTRGTPPPEYLPLQSGLNPNQVADRGRHRNGGNGGRDPGDYGQGSGARDTGQIEDDRSHIYRPRPENFRGKPPKPTYMQQNRSNGSAASAYLGGDAAQYPAFRESRAADAYF